MLIKQTESGSSCLRYTMAVPLPPDQALDSFINFEPESMQWREKIKRIIKMKELGPDDLVVGIERDMPKMIMWAMGMPDITYQRVVVRKNFPAPGQHSYATVP